MLATPAVSFFRSSSWNAYAATLLLAIAWIVPAHAQPEPPYTGVISVDTVQARGSAGRVFYPVADLVKGDRVIVEDDDFFTWFRIQAPSNVLAVISEADVEAGGDGTQGTVTADIAPVRVLGTDRGAADSFKTLKSLSRGDQVRIVDREANSYIIEAPKGSLVFLPPGSVTPLANQPEFDAQEPAPMVAVEPAPTPEPTPPSPTAGPGGGSSTNPAQAGATTPPSSTGDAEAANADPDQAPATGGMAGDMVPLDAPSADADDTGAGDLPPLVVPAPLTAADSPAIDLGDGSTQAGEAATASDDGQAGETPAEAAPVETLAVNPELREVELEMLPLFAKPVEEQPLDQIEAAYSQIAAEQELTGVDNRIIENRLAAVRRNRQFAAALAQIEQRQSAVPRVQPVAVDPTPDQPFAAIGVLSVSTVLSADGQTTFRVIDPATRRTIAYLQPAAGVDPALSLGQIVGVRGARQYDPALNSQLIVAQQIRVLDPGS